MSRELSREATVQALAHLCVAERLTSLDFGYREKRNAADGRFSGFLAIAIEREVVRLAGTHLEMAEAVENEGVVGGRSCKAASRSASHKYARLGPALGAA